MQILSSGSFVNLENREKIEQLIFTAKEIAAAAIETEGFASDEENNRRLALEIWQGAEYMTREHEEANVKNIFVNNFLARVQELAGDERNAPKAFSTRSVDEITVTDEPIQQKDEFLGFVSSPEADQNGGAEVKQIVAEKTNEITIADALHVAPEDLISDGQSESNVIEQVDPNDSLVETTQAVEPVKAESENANSTNEVTGSDSRALVQSESSEKSVVSVVSLPEKEPYQFDKCTVTTIIQLLPVEAEHKRRAVISVRTHDFAPQISTHTFPSEIGLDALVSVVNDALNRYNQELPLKVMDKLKREKGATKRQTTANKSERSETKNSCGASLTAKVPENKAADNGAATTETGATTATTANSGAKPDANKNESLSQSKASATSAKPQESQQGSLFGF